MGFDTTGYVLKSARSAPSNATTTAGADSGVLREHATLPGSYLLPGDFVEISADQYRAGVLENPSGTTQEYLFWAANSSNIGILEDASWVVDTGSGSIPVGSSTVASSGGHTYTDGTSRVVVADDGGRSLAGILSVTLVRGDDPLTPIEVTSFESTDADAGVITLNAGTLTTLGGGLSNTRGDTVTAVSYYLASQKFWWTRNDESLARFGWNGVTQRWEPFKGSAPKSLGQILEGSDYALTPAPSRFTIGVNLPGDVHTLDSYAMIRVGQRPDATSTPVTVRVVGDDQVTDTYTFPAGVDAIVGSTSGVLLWNPTFVAVNSGRVAWYVPETYNSESDGVLGALLGSDTAPLFVTPVPGPTERPLLRIGSRRFLTPVGADDDAALALLSVSEGEVGWSRTTGKLKFSSADMAKADPDDPSFELLYLSAQVVSDGVSLTQVAVGTRAPVQLVDSTGTPTTVDSSKELFVPASAPLPSPGTSGVMLVPDGTGMVPSSSPTPTTRANGSGLIRSLSVDGDSFLFGKNGCVEKLDVVEFDSDLPAFPFLLSKGHAEIATELHSSGAGSRVALGLKDRKTFAAEPLYFVQAVVQPAVYATESRLISRMAEPFVLDGTEILAFAVDGTAYTWDASVLGAGSVDAVTLASSLDAVITGTGACRAVNGRVWLEAGNLSTGSVEIGLGSTSSGTFADRDLSGCAVIGFLPGWRVSNPASSDNWLPDGGFALGVYRSPQNLDMSGSVSDMQARGRFTNAVFSKNIPATPVFLLNNPPLLDVAGYDEGVFFQTINGRYQRPLIPFEDILYLFEERRFAFLEQGSVVAAVAQATDSLTLGNTGVVGDTLYPAVNGGQNGLYVAPTGGALSLMTLGEDYLLDQEGQPGVATLIDQVGPQVATGALGTTTQGGVSFADVDATFLTDGVAAGYRLKVISGDPALQGSYVISNVAEETMLEVEAGVPFLASAAGVSWEIYEGFSTDVYDPAIVVDVLYEQFNHLAEEPFHVRVLTLLGAVPAALPTRLSGYVTEALQNGRIVTIRFGKALHSPEAEVTALSRTKLGTIANGALFVPDVSAPHVVNEAFSIRVGSTAYTLGTNLSLVSAFTPETGDAIQVLTTTGGIQFGDATLEYYSEALVYYAEEFTGAVDLAAGSAEVDPVTGEFNLSGADMTSYEGTDAYLVEQMVTEERLDVALAPLTGAVFFRRPIRAFQIVECSYYQADVSGDLASDSNGDPILVEEVLPLYVRLETATRVDDITYSFNTTGRSARSDIEPIVWVNNRRQNYGNTTTCVVDTDANTITFTSPQDSSVVVQINYSVDEAFGGEQGYTVSTTPVFRPPFYLEAEQDSFQLDTDRTADMVPGKLLRVGASPFYVQASAYDTETGQTTVTIFPTPSQEAGSRSPGNDALTLLTTEPVSPEVNGVTTDAVGGFLMPLTAEYEPVDAGMLSMIFRGDVTQFAVAGHLMEIDGYPHILAGAELAPDGTTTRVDVTSPFLRGFDPTSDAVRISVRPIYPPEATAFLGIAPAVETEDVEVVLYGEKNLNGDPLPGRTLVVNRDYTFNFKDGSIQFLSPVQGALKAGQKLVARYTKKVVLQPYMENGSIILPRYKASYAHVTTPSKSNKLLGAYLTGTYSFSNPDSFYVRAVPLRDYMGEVSKIGADRVAARTPHGGPVITSGPAQDNWTFGTIPLLAQERELQDQDRAARVFLSLYNDIILGFEQVLEALDGRVIGDHDGKFRFFVGRGKVYAGPGYEDQITGTLNSRFVWSQVFEAANENFGVSKDDPLVDPETAIQDPTSLVVSGDPLNPWLLDFYIKQQRNYILNDMDDTVLTRKRVKLKFLFDFQQVGVFAKVWAASVVSRLYPERALAFTTTYPGLGAGTLPDDPGVYAFLKLIDAPRLVKGKIQGPVLGSTFLQEIGAVQNPALGLIENITGQVHPRERLARARIWDYSPTGYPDIDPDTAGKPSVIATPLYLKDFPLDPTTGNPDIGQLTANGGSLPDLSTGDVELSTPKWVAYSDVDNIRPQVAFGRPTGETYSIGFAGLTLTSALGGAFTFDPTYKGVFVGGQYSGCILTFTSGDGNEITNAADIVVIGADGISTSEFAPERGDTIYVIPPGSEDSSSFSNPPSAEDVEKMAKSKPFLDVGVRERRSAFVDLSLPSIHDPSPFPIKEIVGQKTATPLQPIEADVEFVNTMRDPFEFPALQGLDTNDSGDHALPYLASSNTELERLAAVSATFTAITQTDSPTPGAVYPDEIVGNDGSILATASGATPPATLLTSRDCTPVTTAGSYTPHSGVADARRYDVLLIEAPQGGIAAGMQGIQSIGDVTSGTVEIPRFVTPTLAGTRIRYVLNNAMVHISDTGVSGVVAQENGGVTTTLNISTVGGLYLNDGSALSNGGLNNIVDNALFTYPNNNVVTIEIIDHTTGLVLETITLTGGNVTGGLGTVAMGAAPKFTDKVGTITAVGFLDFAALGGAAPGPVGPFDFKISVDTFVTALTVTTGSITAYVDQDRLTFVEAMDLRTLMPRDSVTVGGVSIQGELSVEVVTSAGTTSCVVNHPLVVNGGDPFTFLARDAGYPNSIGTFDPSPGTGLGSIKVMSWEGAGNTTMASTSSVTFSVLTSSSQDENGDILSGIGMVYDTGVAGINPSSLLGVGATTGALENVLPGDVVVVTSTSVGDATPKVGTYLVRYGLGNNPVASGYYEVFASVAGGVGSGWLKSPFPVVTAASSGSVTVSGIQSVIGSPSGYDWDATGRLYLFVSPADITTTISRAYTSFVVNGDGSVTFTLDTSGTTGQDATGASISDADFDTASALALGKPVSGMVFLPVGQFQSPLPSNNVVGYGNGTVSRGGLLNLTYRGVGGSYTFDFATDLVDATGTTPAVDEVGVCVSDSTTTNVSTSFVSDLSSPVFLDVPLYVDLRGLADPTSTQYTTIHGAGASAVRCVAPGDVFRSDDGSSTVGTGFRATSGVFLEPSWATPTQNIADGSVKVVDAGHTLSAVAMRPAGTYLVSSPETVNFEVRRIRRFHDVLDGVGANLAPLRFAYEIRTGEVLSYTPSTRLLVAVSDPDSGGGTQLGDFDDPDVNIHPGDIVRLVDASGTLLDSAEVASVIDGVTLKLRAPGFAEQTPSSGDTFEVYLRQAPVPHAQSNEQLLELITDQVVYTSTADPVGNTGGRSDTVNQLKDNGVSDFSSLGIQVGDIILVDPAGELSGATGSATPVEFGSRPIGDQSVSSRMDGSYIAGGPSDLDDNRGWYRVVTDPATTISYLAVSGETDFAGTDGSPVILGATSPTNQQFAVYPSITASGLTGTTEGQMDLRPTKVALPSNSYQDGSYKSIEPFTYRVIRPSSLVGTESVDLILMLRERMLSWMEEMSAATRAKKQGSYYVFQEEEHIADLGSATDGDDGLGVPSNVFITGLSGLTEFAPFANTSDCLSVLDRRYWVLDTRLDNEYPPYSGGTDPYSSFETDNSTSGYTLGSGRPVEPDLIADVLDRGDRIRMLRYAWIKFRANQENGTLPSIDRFVENLPRLIQEQMDFLRMQQSIKDSE